MTYREVLEMLVPGAEELPDREYEALLYEISEFLGEGDRGLQFPDAEPLWDEEEDGPSDEGGLEERLFQCLEEEEEGWK